MNQRSTLTGSEIVYESLLEVDIRHVFGIPGRGSLPLARRIIEGDRTEFIMARHETAIPHMAWGYFEASADVAATLSVPGPGDVNTLNGLRNAAIDEVPIVHLTTATHPDKRGKGAIHEIDPAMFDYAVKRNVSVDDPRTLPLDVASAMSSTLTPPYGPSRIGIPSEYLTAEFENRRVEVTMEKATVENEQAYDVAAEMLSLAEKPVVYAGVEATRSKEALGFVRELVAAIDAPVVTSFKGKGVVAESDPRWAGTTGKHAPSGTIELLGEADVVLAIGTRFGGPSTAYWSIPMGERLIHITRHPTRVNEVYEADVGIVDDVAAACREIVSRLEPHASDGWSGSRLGSQIFEEYNAFLDDRGVFDDTSPAQTPAVLRSLREVTPENTIFVFDIAIVRGWGFQLLEVPTPDCFLTSGFWTTMGIGLPGSLGAKLAQPNRPVVCVTGDGGLMMAIHELHTASEYDIDVTTVVINNGTYGMISNVPELSDKDWYDWHSPDFCRIAEGFGCAAVTVDTASGAGDAVAEALETDRATLVNVNVVPDALAPWEVSYESTVDFA